MPGGISANEAFVKNNQTLRDKVASGANPDVVLADWYGYTSATPTWLSPDGIHLTPTGAYGVADYISRTIANIEGRPCPQPWVDGGPVDAPCPDPDLHGPPANVVSLVHVTPAFDAAGSPVEIARPESLEVERDVPVAGGLHGVDDRDPMFDGLGQHVRVELDAGGVAVVANPDLREPQPVQRGLRPIDPDRGCRPTPRCRTGSGWRGTPRPVCPTSATPSGATPRGRRTS